MAHLHPGTTCRPSCDIQRKHHDIHQEKLRKMTRNREEMTRKTLSKTDPHFQKLRASMTRNYETNKR